MRNFRLSKKNRLALCAFIILLMNSCSDSGNKTNPIAKIGVFPAIGDTSTVFDLSGESSINYGDIQMGLNYFWFVDDTIRIQADSSQPNAAVRFRTIGQHRIQLKVDNRWRLTDTTSTVVLVKLFRKDSFCVDPRDNRKYNTVLLNSVWWFAENLKYGTKLNINELPSNNGITERYVKFPELNDQDGYYLPEEAHLYSLNPDSSICPPGWSLPDYETCRSLGDIYIMNNNHDFFISGGITGVNLDNAGYFNVDSARFDYSSNSYWWGREIILADHPAVTYGLLYMNEVMHFIKRPYYQEGLDYFPERELFQEISFALPVRCIKKEE
jgi:uncharacterized protein (TIGR02145 family)